MRPHRQTGEENGRFVNTIISAEKRGHSWKIQTIALLNGGDTEIVFFFFSISVQHQLCREPLRVQSSCCSFIPKRESSAVLFVIVAMVVFRALLARIPHGAKIKKTTPKY